MRIAVCVDQVVTSESPIHLERASRSISPIGLAYASNPTDDGAVGEALHLDGDHRIGVFAIGSESVEQILRGYLAAGVDEAVRLWDSNMQDADDMVQAQVFAAALRRWSADLVLCGGLHGERDLRVMGPFLAELLGLPQVTGVVRATLDGARLVMQRRADGFVETVECPVAAVVSIDRGRGVPYPTFPNRIRASAATIEVWGTDTLGLGGELLRRLPMEIVSVTTAKPRRKVPLDSRAAWARTLGLLLGGVPSGGGGAILDGDAPDTADRVVELCLRVLRNA